MSRLRDFVFLAAKMLMLAKPLLSITAAATTIRGLLDGGAGLTKFQEFVEAQGGDRRIVQEPHLLRQASLKWNLAPGRKGTLFIWIRRRSGARPFWLGAGRAQKGDSIDLAAGIKLHRRCGDFVSAGDVLATLFSMKRVNRQRPG